MTSAKVSKTERSKDNSVFRFTPKPIQDEHVQQVDSMLHHRGALVILLFLLGPRLTCSLAFARRVLSRVGHLILQDLDEVVEADSTDGTASRSCLKLVKMFN